MPHNNHLNEEMCKTLMQHKNLTDHKYIYTQMLQSFSMFSWFKLTVYNKTAEERLNI